MVGRPASSLRRLTGHTVRVTRRLPSWRLFLLPAWTFLVWGPRIRNIWADADLEVVGQLLRTGYAVVFLIFALHEITLRWRAMRSVVAGALITTAFVIWTIGFWLVRGTQIALADHDTAFIVVHSVLGLVSIVLAALHLRAVRSPDPASSGRSGADAAGVSVPG